MVLKTNKDKSKRSIQNRRYFVNDILVRGIYKLFDGKDVVYVGQSKNNVFSRISKHYAEGAKKFDSFTFIDCANLNDIELDYLEKKVIKKYWPKYNVTHNKV